MHHLVANSELLVDLVDRHTVVEVEDPDRLALAGELPILEAERMSAATDSFGSFDDFLDVLDVLLCFERFVDELLELKLADARVVLDSKARRYAAQFCGLHNRTSFFRRPLCPPACDPPRLQSF